MPSSSGSTSFRAGSVWNVGPIGTEPVYVNDRAVTTPTALGDHDVVQLGDGLRFRYRIPDLASQTVLLELLGGTECEGARAIVLFGEGEGGRLRIGAADGRHVRVAGLEHEITLFQREERLIVACEATVQGAEAGEEGVGLPLPPPQRFDLSIGRPVGGRPPFGLAIEPVDSGASTSG